MTHDRPVAIASTPSPSARWIAALMLTILAAMTAWSVAIGWSARGAPAPFHMLDIFVVQVVCASPLGIVLAKRIRRTTSDGLCLGVAFMLWPVAEAASLVATSGSLAGAACRATVALCLAIAWALLVGIAFARDRSDASNEIGTSSLSIALGLLVLFVPPATYLNARFRHDAGRMGEFESQMRLLDASRLASAWAALDGDRIWQGQTMSDAAVSVNRVVAQVETRIAQPVPTDVGDEQRIARANDLAMLGRSDEALSVLAPANEPARAAEAHQLRAWILENEERWQEGIAAHRAELAAWQDKPTSIERNDGVLRATRGIAYCQRKAGQYAAAEATYLGTLAMAPTAETHFLLAQFYEDAQDAKQAELHAKKAAALVPEQYAVPAKRLIDKLRVYHFRCWGVGWG